MKLFITTDEWWEAGIHKLVSEFIELAELFFDRQSYGDGLAKLSIVICCSPNERLSQRKKFSVTERRLSYDVIINFFELKNFSDVNSKKKYLLKETQFQTETIINRYSSRIQPFDNEKFLNDFRAIIDDSLIDRTIY